MSGSDGSEPEPAVDGGGTAGARGPGAGAGAARPVGLPHAIAVDRIASTSARPLRVGNLIMRSKVMAGSGFIDPPLAHSYIRAPWRFPPWNRLRDADIPARETDDCP